jgi:hypothetical protein
LKRSWQEFNFLKRSWQEFNFLKRSWQEFSFLGKYILLIPAVYISAKGVHTDPEGMIFQTLLFPVACFLWSFIIFKFLLNESWIYSIVISLVLSIIIVSLWIYHSSTITHQGINRDINYFITNLVTFPLWYPLFYLK